MSFDNWNLRNLRENYPFLKELWDLYDGFDKTVVRDYESVYDGICRLVKDSLQTDKEEYNDICMKVMRNLDPLCNAGETCIRYSDRCSNVNSWIYNTIDKKYLNNKHIIKRIFDLTGTIRPNINSYGCPYYSYDTEYKEPINTIHLKIFTDYMAIIKQTLMSNGQPNNTLCQKYVCKCVNIYKRMNALYCSDYSTRHGENKKTCDMLDALKTQYNAYLSANPEISPKIPSLEDTEDELLAKCPSLQAQHSLSAVEGDNSGSSTSKIPATIGTMAGVSSVFAQLYKLTPAGRWINTGLRGSGGRINNSFYKNGADDLIINGLEHNNFNSYNIGYEAA